MSMIWDPNAALSRVNSARYRKDAEALRRFGRAGIRAKAIIRECILTRKKERTEESLREKLQQAHEDICPVD
jgi:hypothetical protein